MGCDFGRCWSSTDRFGQCFSGRQGGFEPPYSVAMPGDGGVSTPPNHPLEFGDVREGSAAIPLRAEEGRRLIGEPTEVVDSAHGLAAHEFQAFAEFEFEVWVAQHTFIARQLGDVGGEVSTVFEARHQYGRVVARRLRSQGDMRSWECTGMVERESNRALDLGSQ